jgi:crotonobetainyl-CoA:carnitine CoA-transferase CaiB-like acyl-CoA transferase
MGALDGVRVIDLGQWIAGPLAAMLLGDQGAEIIRVDPPGGPRWKTPANAAWNRGKQQLVLDLKRGTDLATARHLIERADVVIENFRPGVMARLGLGPDEATRGNPRLIYCSLPGFASDDPRAAMPAWEGVLGAATGAYWQPGEPRFTALPISSTFGALAAAVAIVMALIARQRDGLGQRIEVPLLDATVLAIGSGGLLVNGKPDGARPDDPWGGLFQCADGRWVRLSLATFRFLQRFVAAAGHADWIEKGYVQAERPGRLARGTELRARQQEELLALFRARTAADWEELGRRAEVPLTLVRTSAEWLGAEHPRTAGIVTEVVDGEFGRMLQPGFAVRLLGTPGAIRPRAERDGEAALDRSLLPPRQSVTETPRVAAALQGMRVVDLTQVLAGPTAARTLAEFGADVVKINNPREEGAGYRWQVHRYHTDVNRGKRTILLDLKKPEGLEVFKRLVEDADVVLQNFRPGVAERLGVGYEQMRARKPDIVYGSVGFLGEGGPWESMPGYEPNAQAATGMMARMAGHDGPPAMQPFACNDYATGLLGALALGLALFNRQVTGAGQHVQTSLAAAATLLQSPYLQMYAGKVWNEPGGPEAVGWGALQRLYRASDGWRGLGATDSKRLRLDTVLGLSGIAGLRGAELESALAIHLATRPAGEWASRFAAAGIGAQPVISTTQLMQDPWLAAHGLSVTREHTGGAMITTVGPPARLSRTPVVPGRPVSPPGGDAAEILARIGLADRLDDLVGKRVIALE